MSTILFGSILISCQPNYLPTGLLEETVSPYAIVSVLVNNQSANIQIKVPLNDNDAFKINLRDASEAAVSLSRVSSSQVANFKLLEYTAPVKGGSEEYHLDLQYPDRNSVLQTITRVFSGESSGSWQKLAHAPITKGEFTGTLLFSKLSNRMGVCRYANAETWDILKYVGSTWESTEGSRPLPRHNALAFVLNDQVQKETVFFGFGYQVDEKLPDKKAYLNDFWWPSSFYSIGKYAGIIFPLFDRSNADLKYFQSSDNAYILKENSTGEMLSFNLTWDREYVNPFPESTGRLACFFVNGTGYVINQFGEQKPHLYAYDISNDTWTRKADFPGRTYDQGTAFSAAGNGYFGLGLTAEKEGVREIWKYDVLKDRWSIHSIYPGQGHELLLSCSLDGKAYLGWGYENLRIKGFSASKWIGCTDFWQFNP